MQKAEARAFGSCTALADPTVCCSQKQRSAGQTHLPGNLLSVGTRAARVQKEHRLQLRLLSLIHLCRRHPCHSPLEVENRCSSVKRQPCSTQASERRRSHPKEKGCSKIQSLASYLNICFYLYIFMLIYLYINICLYLYIFLFKYVCHIFHFIQE